MSASMVVNFKRADVSTPSDVVLTIKDWCTDDPVPGAEVTLTVAGMPRTVTADSSGKVTFNDVPPGKHALKITAPGYLSSNTDTLANDSIQI